MSLKSENVRVAVTGAVYVAPTTAKRPGSASEALSTDHKDLGYISDAGLTETRDRSTNQIRAWQNGALVREPVTESSIKYTFVLLETKLETIELYYGIKVAANGSVKIDPSRTGGRKSFVVDVIDEDDLIRVDIPQGEVTEVGDQVFANGEAIGYEVTVTGYAITDGDESYSAVKWYSSLDTTATGGN